MSRPLLAPRATISALQNRLIVLTTPQNLAELRKVLDALDSVAKRIVISVRQALGTISVALEAQVTRGTGTQRARERCPGHARGHLTPGFARRPKRADFQRLTR